MKKIKENKGFSLVELIIVIAIMAILVGVVGTQVVPYLNKSREAKDFQVISAYNTAFVSAFSMCAADIDPDEDYEVVLYTGELTAATATTDKQKVELKINGVMKELTAADAIGDLTSKLKTSKGGTVTKVTTTYSASDKTATTQAYAGTTPVFDEIVSYL